jgi:hypothetical protein
MVAFEEDIQNIFWLTFADCHFFCVALQCEKSKQKKISIKQKIIY